MAGGAPRVGALEAVIDAVADEVGQRVGEDLDDALVELGVLADEHEVHLFAGFAVDGAVLVNDLGSQVWVREEVLPAVNEHRAKPAVLIRPKDAPHGARGRIVLRLFSVRAVVGLEHVEEIGQWLARVPQLEPLALDDAVVFGVDDLRVQLLPPNACALVLRHDFVTKRGCEVIEILVRRARGDDDTLLAD
jgi:hypothetical protein